MTNLEKIVASIEAAFSGQTLATMRKEAAKELNGTSTKTMRLPNGQCAMKLICITGEYEQRKLGRLSPNTREVFGDWESVPILDAVNCAFTKGGFAYAFESESSHNPGALMLIMVGPEMISKFEMLSKRSP